MGEYTNALLLLAEGGLYFAVMTGLFRLRHRVGIGVFYCALGTMHFVETYLAAALYVQLPGGIVISPGSVVFFTGKLIMLLLVYIREDAAAVRQPIYGLFLGNMLIVGAVTLLRQHQMLPVGEGAPDLGFLDQMSWLMVWGTTLLFVDSILIILLYERTAAWLGNRQVLRILISAAVVLTFDQVGFFTTLWFYVGVPLDVLYGGWIAKMGAAMFYAVLAGFYLRYGEAGRVTRRRLWDVFETLTYRQRYEALLRQSGIDALTGVFDRGRFDQEAARAIEAATATRPVSLLVIDVDHFKEINDRYGHATGDEALRQIARELGIATREGDRVYRYGGEEFIVMCQGLPHAAALLAAERLRLGISEMTVQGISEKVTGSIGVATAPEDGADLASLFEVGDSRLYVAKEEGRNRVRGHGADIADISPERPAQARQ